MKEQKESHLEEKKKMASQKLDFPGTLVLDFQPRQKSEKMDL